MCSNAATCDPLVYQALGQLAHENMQLRSLLQQQQPPPYGPVPPGPPCPAGPAVLVEGLARKDHKSVNTSDGGKLMLSFPTSRLVSATASAMLSAGATAAAPPPNDYQQRMLQEKP